MLLSPLPTLALPCPPPPQRWGLLLLRPELGQTAEGCDMVEQAAAMYAAAGRPQVRRGGRAGVWVGGWSDRL